MFASIDYQATGEGLTVYLYVGKKGNLFDTMVEAGAHPYFARGAEEHTKEEFLKRWSHHLPRSIKNLIAKGTPIQYFSHLHFNLS